MLANSSPSPEARPTCTCVGALVLLVCLLSSCMTSTNRIAKGPTVKIMALGDSITVGNGTTTGGYRKRLQVLLREHGYSFDFVGSRTFLGEELADPEHEGWGGYTIRENPPTELREATQLYGHVTKNALTTYSPDILLLMAGTNDLCCHINIPEHRTIDERKGWNNVDSAVHDLGLLLEQIFSLHPKIEVFVAGIVNSPEIPEESVLKFNNGGASASGVKQIAKKYADLGYRITFVDGMEGVLPRTREAFPDGWHPAPDAYDKIGERWFEALDRL